MSPRKNLLIAIGCALLAALANSIMAACIKWEVSKGVMPGFIVFWRSFYALIFLAPLFAISSAKDKELETFQRRGESKSDRKIAVIKAGKSKKGFFDFSGRFWIYFIRVFFGFIGVYLFCFIVITLSLGIATLLFFTIPLFMPFVAYVWKGHPLPRWGWIGLIIGFAGVLLIIDPEGQAFNFAILLGLLSGLATTIGQFAAHLLIKRDPARKINLYYFAGLGLFGGITTLYDPIKYWGDLTWIHMLFFVAIGFFAITYQQLLTFAMKHGPPVLITSILYTVVLYSLIFDVLIWHVLLNWKTLIGISLVILGVILKLILHHIDIAHLKKKMKK